MDEISRKFRVKRGERDVIYEFITYSCVFEVPPAPFQKLYLHLREAMMHGVEDKEYQSVTSLPLLITATPVKIPSELIALAQSADYHGCGNKQHQKLQRYFLDHDPCTLAIEVPVALDNVLGHIDIIRIKGDKIQVVDFKPLAYKEKLAPTQVKRYMEMLIAGGWAEREQVEGYYFDDLDCYQIT